MSQQDSTQARHMSPLGHTLPALHWASDITDSQAHDLPLGLATPNETWTADLESPFDEGFTGPFVDQDFQRLDTSFDSPSLYHPHNSLGLDHDPLDMTPRIIETDPSLRTTYSPGSHSRTALPQIVTSSLSPRFAPSADSISAMYSGYPASPASSMNTGPVTPASLPASQLMLPGQHPALLSPTSPYMWPYQSPASKSPYTLSPSIPRSPSTLSQASYSPSDDLHAPPPIVRRPHPVPTVQEIAAKFPYSEYLVPQRTYRPHTQSDRRRYVEEVDLEEPIMFLIANPDECGIPCRDALNCRFARLSGRDDQMFVQRGPSVSIRIMWPGYAPWSRQIPTRDFRSPPGPITRSKLAKNVAKTVQRFIEDVKTKALEEDTDPKWKIGNGSVTLDDLELVGLQHVSMGSWQIHLRLRRRR